jgi:hypothetical protein
MTVSANYYYCLLSLKTNTSLYNHLTDYQKMVMCGLSTHPILTRIQKPYLRAHFRILNRPNSTKWNSIS